MYSTPQEIIVNMLQALIGPVSKILDKFVPDADKKAALAHEIATMAEKHAHEIALAQIEVNKVEASSPSLFKSGWRPAVAWICVTAFGWHFALQPIITFWLALSGIVLELPEFDMYSLLTVLGGLIGLGTFRSYEKLKGLTK